MTGRGLFVTLEGVEGSGKSTLAAAMREDLTAAGYEVVVTAEPGGDGVADRIRKLLLDSVDAISDRAELLLFEASRAQHVDTKIQPALKRGAIVICDRFTDSSLAYQGYARGIDLDTIRALNGYATAGLKPDLTILLDVPVKTGLERQIRTDRVSSEGIEFHAAVREGYLSIAEAEPERFAIIDSSKGPDDVLREALAAVKRKL